MMKLILLYVMIIVGVIGGYQTARADLNAGLVAYYPFNGNANDESGNGNHGTAHGGVNYTTGPVGQAANFNGVDGYIQVPNDPSLNPAELTLSAWYKVSKHPNSPDTRCNWFSMIMKENPRSYDNHYYTISMRSAGKIDANTWDQYGPVAFVASPTSSLLDTWYHVAASFDSTRINLYVNGVLVNTTPTGFPLWPGDKPLIIGWSGFWCGWYWNGAIDEVRIYNRILSATEIKKLFQDTKPLTSDFSWPMFLPALTGAK